MGVTLAKGGNVSLDKQAPNLTAVAVGLGWDVRSTTGTDFDLDASALATGDNKKVLSDEHFVFFNNLRSPDGRDRAHRRQPHRRGRGRRRGHQRRPAGRTCRPSPTSSSRSRSTMRMHAAQSFGQVRNAYIRVVDRANGSELARYDLSEDASTETAMVFGELYRNGEWKFRAIGQGYASGLAGIARDYGVNV